VKSKICCAVAFVSPYRPLLPWSPIPEASTIIGPTHLHFSSRKQMKTSWSGKTHARRFSIARCFYRRAHTHTMTATRLQGHRRRRKRASLLLFLLIFIVCFLVSYVWTWSKAARYVDTVSIIAESNFLPLGEWRAQAPSPKADPLASLLDCRNRNFTLNPVTAKESEFLTQNDTSGITAAVCHRTLFGSSITLDPLFAFVSYYRLLGFDHIFFWYRPDIASVSRFDELNSLPYVTLTEYTGGGREEGQLVVEAECLSNSTYAADYTWALPIDADEFLWFNSHMSIKDFLSIYNSSYDFLSFGKWMYTILHGVRLKKDSGFGLDTFAFTAKSHCSHNFSSTKPELQPLPQNRSYSYCPGSKGRCKVIAKPARHKKVKIHGMYFSLLREGRMHFDTSIAHFKEWRGILMKHRKEFRYRPPVDFNTSRYEEVELVDLVKGHELVVDGKVLMRYDGELQDWMRFVASGCIYR